VNLPSRESGHGRAAFSRRANRRSTLRIFVSPAHVKDRLKQGDGVFESGLGNRRQIA
jgi:hypothetical protein